MSGVFDTDYDWEQLLEQADIEQEEFERAQAEADRTQERGE